MGDRNLAVSYFEEKRSLSGLENAGEAGHTSNFEGVIGGMPARSDLENLAGAVGFEPTPSALTVRCPTGWTTPQQIQNVPFSPY